MDLSREDFESMSIWELRGYARKIKMEFIPLQIQPTKAKRGVLIAYIKIIKEMIEKYKDMEIIKEYTHLKPRTIPVETKELDGLEISVPKKPNARIGHPYAAVPDLKRPDIVKIKDGSL